MNEKGRQSSEFAVGASLIGVLGLEGITDLNLLGYEQLVAITWLGCTYILGRSVVKAAAAWRGNRGGAE